MAAWSTGIGAVLASLGIISELFTKGNVISWGWVSAGVRNIKNDNDQQLSIHLGLLWKMDNCSPRYGGNKGSTLLWDSKCELYPEDFLAQCSSAGFITFMLVTAPYSWTYHQPKAGSLPRVLVFGGIWRRHVLLFVPTESTGSFSLRGGGGVRKKLKGSASFYEEEEIDHLLLLLTPSIAPMVMLKLDIRSSRLNKKNNGGGGARGFGAYEYKPSIHFVGIAGFFLVSSIVSAVVASMMLCGMKVEVSNDLEVGEAEKRRGRRRESSQGAFFGKKEKEEINAALRKCLPTTAWAMMMGAPTSAPGRTSAAATHQAIRNDEYGESDDDDDDDDEEDKHSDDNDDGGVQDSGELFPAAQEERVSSHISSSEEAIELSTIRRSSSATTHT
eukprot:jgi/Bigna1/66673/fgenesh1_pg.2_\